MNWYQAQYESDGSGWIDILGETYLTVAKRYAKAAAETGYPVRIVEVNDKGEFIQVVEDW